MPHYKNMCFIQLIHDDSFHVSMTLLGFVGVHLITMHPYIKYMYRLFGAQEIFHLMTMTILLYLNGT